MTSASRPRPGYGTQARVATARRRRRLTWAVALLWASDWIFVWTEDLGIGELGAWLRLIGFGFLVYRSVVGTKLPEWLLTWLWMLGVLLLWLIEIAWLGDFALDAELASSADPLRTLSSGFPARIEKTADVLAATLAVAMLGWLLGLFEALLAAVCSSVAFAIRRNRLEAEAPELDSRPVLLERERAAHRTLVALQAPLFVLLVAASVTPLSAGVTLWQGAELLPPDHAGARDIAQTLVLFGFVAFVLAVLELRQLQSLRWCGRPRLVIAALVPILVLGSLCAVALVGPLLWWALVGVALLWCLAQVSAVRVLWAVRGREATRASKPNPARTSDRSTK